MFLIVSSDNDFAPLRRYISTSHNLFIKDVTYKKNRLYTRELKLKRLYWVISSRFLPNLVIFQTITGCQLRNKHYASKLVYRQILSHISWLFYQKLTFSAFQHSRSPSTIKLRRESIDLSIKSLYVLDVERAFRHTFPFSDWQCLPPGDPRVHCVQHGIRLLANHSLIFDVQTKASYPHPVPFFALSSFFFSMAEIAESNQASADWLNLNCFSFPSFST